MKRILVLQLAAGMVLSMCACGVLPIDFSAVICYTEQKDAKRQSLGVFCPFQAKRRMECPDGSESGKIIVFHHRL